MFLPLRVNLHFGGWGLRVALEDVDMAPFWSSSESAVPVVYYLGHAGVEMSLRGARGSLLVVLCASA